MNTSKKYFENLDALRFFAFFTVFISHAIISNSFEISSSALFLKIKYITEIGFLGLDFFFVLSSFLITWTIFEEYRQAQFFSFKNFVVRRMLRIWPLYFFIVLLGFSAYFIFNPSVSCIPDLVYFLFFILNFYIIKNGQEFLFFLVFLWSIAVEDQFYLFWALALKFAKKYFIFLNISLIISSLIFRWYFINNSNQLYFNTISIFSNFGIGGLCAYLVVKTNIKATITSLSKNSITIVYLLLLLCLIFFHKIFSIPFFVVFQKLWFSLLFGFIILEQSYSNHSIIKVKNVSLLSYLGKISYGLYCFHGVVITILIKLLAQLHFTETFWHVFLLYPLIILVFSILFAHLSFRYFENYFLKLKAKFYTFTNNK